MPWWIATLLGSVCLALKNAWSRSWDMTIATVILMQIPLFLAGMFYWYGFRHAPKFINCWFAGSAMNAVFGLTTGILLFDKGIDIKTSVGVVFALVGVGLLATG